MTGYIFPLLRTGDREAQAEAFAGSPYVWLEGARALSRTGPDERLAMAQLTQAVRSSLLAPRADICGVAMDRPRIMGILNVTPDSFSDGGRLADVRAAVDQAQAMAGDVDFIDIGGESTRPGAAEVSIAEEITRTAPVIRAIRDAGISTPISIDTRKAAVAQAALDAGADMVNDVTALRFDPEMAGVVAQSGVPVCLMHSIATPETMQAQAIYDDVLLDVYDHLAERVDMAVAAGIARDRLIVDPGIGFGKTLQHNVTLLRAIAVYHGLGLPVLLGASRKRFIGTISGVDEPSKRLGGSLSVALHGAAQGVQIMRVHDTRETRQALSLQMTLMRTTD